MLGVFERRIIVYVSNLKAKRARKHRLMALAVLAIALIPFAWVNAQIAESVGTIQLDRSYACSLEGATCRGSFGNIVVRRLAVQP